MDVAWLSMVDAAIWDMWTDHKTILQDAFHKCGLLPMSLEKALAAGQPKEVEPHPVVTVQLPADIEAELHVPREHLQLKKSREPLQHARCLVESVNGFLTSQQYVQLVEEW